MKKDLYSTKPDTTTAKELYRSRELLKLWIVCIVFPTFWVKFGFALTHFLRLCGREAQVILCRRSSLTFINRLWLLRLAQEKYFYDFLLAAFAEFSRGCYRGIGPVQILKLLTSC